jgi:cellulose biosynthesis protein BcsQ
MADMKVVSILGKKGGSGKTLMSHYLAHGMASGLGLDTVVLQTDVRTERPTEIVDAREYIIQSIKNESPDADWNFILRTYVKLESRNPSPVLIIDGGANRSKLDLKLTLLSDIVLIPCGFSKEDIAVAEADFWAMAKAIKAEKERAMGKGKAPLKDTQVFLLRNRWPGTQRLLDSVLSKEWIEKFMVQYDRMDVLFPRFVPDMQSLMDIAVTDDPRHTPRINGSARAFAEILATMLGIPFERQPMGTVQNPGKLPILQEMDAA